MSRLRRSSWLVPLLLVGLGLAGCAAGSSPGVGVGGDRKMLTAEEMEASGYTDVFNVVQALRPRWLSTRGTTSINQQESVKVYMDGNLLGGPSYLRGIPVRSISSIRFMDGLEATNRWGLDHGLGAIVISTRRGSEHG